MYFDRDANADSNDGSDDQQGYQYLDRKLFPLGQLSKSVSPAFRWFCHALLPARP